MIEGPGDFACTHVCDPSLFFLKDSVLPKQRHLAGGLVLFAYMICGNTLKVSIVPSNALIIL